MCALASGMISLRDKVGLTMTSTKQAQCEAPPFEDMVWIPGGTFLMGSDKHYPEESPAHEVTVDGFCMDRHTVTNEEFRKFVEATKYVTSAERAPKAEDYPGAKPELLVPASVVFNKPRQRVDLRDCYNWWIYVRRNLTPERPSAAGIGPKSNRKLCCISLERS